MKSCDGKDAKAVEFGPREFVRVMTPITFTMTGDPVILNGKKEKT